MKKLSGVIMAALMVAVLALPALSQEVQKPPIMLKASEVLPQNLSAGPNYKVAEAVVNDGLVNTYQLETKYGPLTVESTGLLLIRINELRAIDRMEQLKGSDVYKDALIKSAVAPLKTVEGLVTAPVETTSAVVSGIGRWFGDVGRSITSDDPHQAGVLKTATGYASAKRAFAYELGVDPYSSYQPLQKALDEVAQTAGLGGLTVKVAFAAIPGGVGTVISTSGTAEGMRSLVRDKSPAELEKINAEKLKEMGIPEALAKVFLKNPNYDPQEKTALVGELATMSKVKDRAAFITAASLANQETVAIFMRLRAQLMALYSSNKGSVERFVEADGAPLLFTSQGTVVGIFPFDYVAWTPLIDMKEMAVSEAIKKMPGVKGKELWIGGTIDPKARKALEARGWAVVEKLEENLLRRSL
ncbi:MAG: hypothetical protein M0Z67_03120 [Nitrospiraceae bacterium]|nr:hypothetical protein [Nitrospiraceae bacterium]